MKVLLINKFFYEKGGTERYFFLLSEELGRRGHDVIHFSMQHPDNRPSPYSEYFVTRKDYDTPKGLARSLLHGASFIRSREAARNIRALITRHRPDVAHLQNIYHQITPAIIPVLDQAGIPIVMTLHDYKLICPNYSLFAHGAYCYRCKGGRFYQAARTRCAGGSLSRSLLLSVEAYWQRRSGVYKSVRRFVAPSRFMQNTFVAAGFTARRLVYLPGFLPTASTKDTQPLTEDGRNLLGGLPASYVLYFGRLSPEKGLRTLIDVAKVRPDIQLVVCGEGPMGAQLKSEVVDNDLLNVRFTGYAEKRLLDKIVQRAGVVVLPTLSPENAPFTVLESAAAGVPVIVSDMGGLPEMANVVGGWIFRHGDSADLAARIDEVLSDPVGAREKSAAGREAAEQFFNRQKHADAIEKLYQEVVG